MNQQDLMKQVTSIISDQNTGVLSSVENNKPHSRYMTFYSEELTFFTPTKKDTEKINEIKKNPSVSILLGYENGQHDAYVEISGTATINESQDLKRKFWNDSFANWFEGPDDPNYVFFEVQPEVIRLLNIYGGQPKELIL